MNSTSIILLLIGLATIFTTYAMLVFKITPTTVLYQLRKNKMDAKEIFHFSITCIFFLSIGAVLMFILVPAEKWFPAQLLLFSGGLNCWCLVVVVNYAVIHKWIKRRRGR